MKKSLALKEHSTSLSIILRIIDCLGLLSAGLLSYWLRFSSLSLDLTYKNVLLLGVLLGAASLSFFGAYRAWRGASFTSEIRCVLSATLTTFLLLIISGFVTQSSDLFSRIWVVSWLCTSTATILSYRFLLRKSLGALRAKGFNIRSVIIIGDGELAQQVLERLKQHPEMGLVVKGILSTQDQAIDKHEINSVPFLGTLNDLDKIVKNHKIDQVWIALPMSEVQKMEQVQSALSNTSIVIRMVPDIFGFRLLNQSMTEVAGLPVINISTSHMLEGKNRFLKSLEDKILASIILLLISPILVALAITIKLTSKGPILFKQYRTGANGQDFKVYKFRSMVVHNEEDGKVTQATKGDSRITPIGAFMRRTSLDELPQFINVLQGRMSIVGPRPHALAHNEHYKTLVESYMRRHMVKPGITGWAQVNGFRGETDTIDKMENRVEYDLYYIENWSVWFDLRIIFLTIFKGFIHKNAI
ncbi:undecaprenyl-phosphate glucose phosphotransferase [Marinomonas sp. BSi20584]|uniref:undecaprenyl-phosphate glucose phosphotransferase n=1 Tax=Marinomonas sp. BSi20584 TaxID=1594462 RepID=UPI000C1F7828|nr:undecaprenyl-phosphate glucose phosphotransferase [Marinomonas sp. BSi20584]PJE53273.1 UDP-phosphate galactose phosphotransferase [Marinomonas sp. BSi20584]